MQKQKGENKMKKIILFIIWFSLVSCHDQMSFPSIGKSKPVQLTYRISEEPRIYLSQQDRFINFKELNRSKLDLSLSDRIIFSDKIEEETSSDLDKLESFKGDDDLKIKISSFCSYTKSEPDQTSDTSANRVFQEVGSLSYHWSFSVFELLPNEMLLDGLDKTFYCSFIFAFKNDQGEFNHYNMAQQTVQPFFSQTQTNVLSLIRKTEEGYYLPVDSVIQAQDISKILLLNNTGNPVKNYHLFCEGLKVITVPDFKWGVEPVFFQLLNYKSNNSLPTGILKCRFFSESHNKKITGITYSFQLDFNGLRNKKEALDLKEIVESVSAMTAFGKKYQNGDRIPLNSYFYFSHLKEISDSVKDYSAIHITVNTECTNKGARKSEILSEEYNFPFRKKIPVMAVTPKKMFFMRKKRYLYHNWLKLIQSFKGEVYNKRRFESIVKERQTYASHCLYQVGLQDKRSQKSKKTELVKKGYFITWDGNSYGVDHDPFYIYLSVSTSGSR